MQGPHQGIGELEPTWFSCPAEGDASLLARDEKQGDK